jgi:predicted nuclease with TOPRIM domain
MPNENEEVNLTNNEEVVETNEVEETQNTGETTDWKAKYEEIQGRLKRAETKLSKVDRTSEKTPSKKSDDFDYGEKAYLFARDIKTQSEMKLVRDVMKDTGKKLEDVLESKYFQAELKEMRDIEQTSRAIPSNSKRTGQSSVNTVDYWLAKGELPPADMPDLRKEYVNAKAQKSVSKKMFYNS